MSTMHRKLIILGSGPAGLTAAIYAARAELQPLVIEGKDPGGQLMGTTAVENWPGQISIMGPQLMIDMRKQAEKTGAQFASGAITSVDFSSKPLKITSAKGIEYSADAVIIATGAIANRLHCPGESDYWGKGITTCAVCDGAFYRDKKVVILGGGDSAMENASFLAKFTKDITIIHILDHLTASKAMQHRVLNNPHITIIYSSTITAFRGNGTRLTGIDIINKQIGASSSMDVDGVFIAIGLSPNTAMLKGQIELDAYGYAVLKKHTMTSVPGVFAAGDVVDYRYKQAITSAGSGCMAALDAERYLSEL